MAAEATHAQLDEFRRLIQEFVRRFGFLSDDTTPCGQPMPVACAHALLLIGREKSRAMPQTALLAHFSIDKSNVSRLVTRLTEMGLVKCRPDVSDRRGRSIALTPKGARMARKLEAASKDRFTRLMQGIPGPKRAPIVAALAELVQALSRLDSGAGSETSRHERSPRSRTTRRSSSSSSSISPKNDGRAEVLDA